MYASFYLSFHTHVDVYGFIECRTRSRPVRQKGWVGCPVITPNGGDSKGNVRPKSPKDSGLGIYSLPRSPSAHGFGVIFVLWCSLP